MIDYCDGITSGWVLMAEGKLFGDIHKGTGFLPFVYDRDEVDEVDRLLDVDFVAIPVLAVLVEEYDPNSVGDSFVFYSKDPDEELECVDVNPQSKWDCQKDDYQDCVWAYPKLFAGPYEFDKFYEMEKAHDPNSVWS